MGLCTHTNGGPPGPLWVPTVAPCGQVSLRRWNRTWLTGHSAPHMTPGLPGLVPTAHGPPYLQHVPCDVLLTGVTADAKLGVVVGLAVGQPVPAKRQAVRMAGAHCEDPQIQQPLT